MKIQLYHCILLTQAGILLCLFFYGPRGWQDIGDIQAQIKQVTQIRDKKTMVVAQLHQEEESWRCDSFNKERVAREELQMAHPSDTVFYR